MWKRRRIVLAEIEILTSEKNVSYADYIIQLVGLFHLSGKESHSIYLRKKMKKKSTSSSITFINVSLHYYHQEMGGFTPIQLFSTYTLVFPKHFRCHFPIITKLYLHYGMIVGLSMCIRFPIHSELPYIIEHSSRL